MSAESHKMARFRLSAVAGVASLVVLCSITAPARAWNAPNDERWGKQWGPVQIGAPDAWTQSTGEGVIVAVVDTGVDVDHPDLKAKLVKGRDFGDGDDNADDDSEYVFQENGQPKPARGHGTHVAGTIAAVTGNREGVAGVAPAAKIMPLKLVAKDSSGNWASSAPEAIRYAAANGAKVINLSITSLIDFGIIRFDFLEGPCNEVYLRGSLCVIASGNGGAGRPSGYNRDLNALIVTANDRDGVHAPFGQKADTKWALSAPGMEILSTYPLEDGGYKETQGTSMAAPHAAGVAALLFAQGLRIDEVVKRMLDTAVSIGDPATNGRGIVDAAAATGAPRTDPPAEAPREQSNILLPKAATRTTLPRKAATQPAAGGAPAPAPTAAPTGETAAQPEGESSEDFASDLATAEGDAELTAGTSEPKADADQLAFYSLATLGGAMVLGTGLSAVGKVRRRRPAA